MARCGGGRGGPPARRARGGSAPARSWWRGAACGGGEGEGRRLVALELGRIRRGEAARSGSPPMWRRDRGDGVGRRSGRRRARPRVSRWAWAVGCCWAFASPLLPKKKNLLACNRGFKWARLLRPSTHNVGGVVDAKKKSSPLASVYRSLSLSLFIRTSVSWKQPIA